MDDTKNFDCWAILEIMGHSKYAGRVSEQAIGGCSFVRVDVPAVDGRLAFTKLFSQGSIFCITFCSEALAKTVASQTYAKPVEVYSPSIQPQLSFSGTGRDDDDEQPFEN